ncbi:MAG: sugar transferase [Bacteroidales bacterium]|nr:sugar transferase [Bacteroidales bacterium]
MYKTFIKPFFDFVTALAALAILLPVIVITSFLILIFMGRPVIFCQLRPGKNAVPFVLYKFRTMKAETVNDGRIPTDSQRLTRLGKILRRTSIDELPQLINVLKGDISIIGPRPLLTEYLEFYSEEQSRRHEVKPGITGWAQVKGRNALTWEEKFELDVYYVDNISFRLDLEILFRTLGTVVSGTDIYDRTGSTMDKFKGNKE